MKTKKPTVAQVVAVLELFARYHPAGLGVLLGQVQPPSTQEIAEIIDAFSGTGNLGVRISGGISIPDAERVLSITEAVTSIIDAIGGWDHIAAITRDLRNAYSPESWNEIADFAAHITPGGSIRDGGGGMGARLFGTDGYSRHDISERTARRRFRHALRLLSMQILSRPPDGGLCLLRSTAGGYPS